MEKKSAFLDTLFLLRKNECITIFTDLKEISNQEEVDAENYFEAEFEAERLEFLSDRIHCNKKSGSLGGKSSVSQRTIIFNPRKYGKRVTKINSTF